MLIINVNYVNTGGIFYFYPHKKCNIFMQLIAHKKHMTGLGLNTEIYIWQITANHNDFLMLCTVLSS